MAMRQIHDPALYKRFESVMTYMMYHGSNLGIFFTGIIRQIQTKIVDAIPGNPDCAVTFHGVQPLLLVQPSFFEHPLKVQVAKIIHELYHLIYEHPLRFRDLDGPKLKLPFEVEEEVGEEDDDGNPVIDPATGEQNKVKITVTKHCEVPVVNLAADAVVNQFLAKDELTPGMVLPENFKADKGRNTEFYWHHIMQTYVVPPKSNQGGGGKSGGSGGGGNGGGNGGGGNQPDGGNDDQGDGGGDRPPTPQEQDLSDQLQQGYGSGGGGINNPHEVWNQTEMDSSTQDMASEIMKSVVRNSAENLDSAQRGTLPDYVKHVIDEAFKPRSVPWHLILRRFAAQLGKATMHKSIARKHKNTGRRPGIRIKCIPRIAVVLDSSGSVGDENWVQFCSEVHHLWKAGAEITVLKHDVRVIPGSVQKYNGRNLDNSRVYGGTDHTDVIRFLNENRFDGAIMLTDGYTAIEKGVKPRRSCKVIWCITQDGQNPVASGVCDYGLHVKMQAPQKQVARR